MYCVVKKYFKAIFKDFPFCHTAIITLFVIVIWNMGQTKSKARYTKYAIPTVITGQRGPRINGEVTVQQYLNRVFEIMGNVL